MKINWFSPLPPAKTGIADYTSRVLPALSKYSEIVLWTDQINFVPEVTEYAKVCHYNLSEISWSEINQADLNIYNVGNNTDFHGLIWEMSCQCPGLVILHDFKLQHLFAGIYREQKNDKEGYLKEMGRYYGEVGKKAAEQFWNGIVSTEWMVEKYPLTNFAIENANGVITHTQDTYNSLAKENRWMVACLPLPYTNDCLSENRIRQSNLSLPYRLIAFGYLGPNRRLDSLLEALACFSQKHYFRLDIYGEISSHKYIQVKIQKLGLEKLVKVHGFVEESVLESALANADLAINLRYPTMGEASYSQLRIWSHALPTLVTKIGWYSTLPNDTVAFIRHDHEIEDIHTQLQHFLDNPEKFAAMGIKGKTILQEQHSPENYANSIVNFSKKVCEFRTNLAVHYLIKRVGEKISSWSSSNISQIELESVANAIKCITL